MSMLERVVLPGGELGPRYLMIILHLWLLHYHLWWVVLGVHFKVIHVRVHKGRVHLKVLVNEVGLMRGLILLLHGVFWVLCIGRVGFSCLLIVLMGVGLWRVVVCLVVWLGLKVQMPPDDARTLLCILMTRLPCWCLI